MKDFDTIFKALSDPIRLAILKKLYTCDSVCVCEFIEDFDLSQSKLSYHLKLLLVSGLVNKESRGKWNFYSVNKDVVCEVLTDDVIQNLFVQK